MKNYLWQKCFECKSKMCCKGYLPKSIFTTKKDKKMLPLINKKSPCAYLGKDGLCRVHDRKPFDCKIFPFDIIKKGKIYYWVVWDMNCPIIKEEEFKFDFYLKEIEKNLLPEFREHIVDFNEWEDQEYKEKFRYKVIRQVII